MKTIWIKRTALELELIELADQYKKLGFSKKYILENIKKVYEDLKEPEKEIKGEMDT